MRSKLLFMLIMLCMLSGCGQEYYDLPLPTQESTQVDGTEKGFYYMLDSTLYYYEYAKEQAMAVCSKADCKHNTDTCDAKKKDCVGDMVFYENDKLYLIESRDDGDFLVMYDSRFNNKQTACRLTEAGTVVGNVGDNKENTAFVMDGYLYYMSVTPTKDVADTGYMAPVSCNRVKVEGASTPEKLGEFMRAVDGIEVWGTTSCAMVSGIAGKIYFVTSTNSRWIATDKCAQYKIALYDTNTSEFQMVMDIEADNPMDAVITGVESTDIYNCCFDEDNNIYFIANWYKADENGNKSLENISLYKRNLDTGKDELLFTSNTDIGVKNVVYKDGNIYLYTVGSMDEHIRIICIGGGDKSILIKENDKVIIGEHHKKILNIHNDKVYVWEGKEIKVLAYEE